jgi:hypothetical protein
VSACCSKRITVRRMPMHVPRPPETQRLTCLRAAPNVTQIMRADKRLVNSHTAVHIAMSIAPARHMQSYRIYELHLQTWKDASTAVCIPGCYATQH